MDAEYLLGEAVRELELSISSLCWFKAKGGDAVVADDQIARSARLLECIKEFRI